MLQKIKKNSFIFFLAGITFFSTACARKSEEKTSIKVGVSVYDSHDTFISELMSDFNEILAEKADDSGIAMSVDIRDAAWNQSTQNSNVEDMLENGCDIICVNLVDRTAPAAIIDLARQKNVPVIFFNREPVEGDLDRWEHLYYVGTDAEQAGKLQGEIAAEAFREHPEYDKNGDGEIKYVMLEGESGHQDAIVRTEVSIATVLEQGFKVKKLKSAIANWDRAQAFTKMEPIIEEFGDEIELIMANNDDMALGAVDAYESAGFLKDDRPVIVGIDGTKSGLMAIDKGDMFGTVYNDNEGQARAMADLVYAEKVTGDLSEIDFTEGRYIRVPHSKILGD